VKPRNLGVKELQLKLLAAGFYLGDGFLFLFALFAIFILSMVADPSSKENRDRFLVLLPVSVWHLALAYRLVLLARPGRVSVEP